MGHTRIWFLGPGVVSSDGSTDNMLPPISMILRRGKHTAGPVSAPLAQLWLRETGHNQSIAGWFSAMEIHSCMILEKERCGD